MRKLGMAVLASTLVMAPYVAFSQDSITTPDEFACALAGDCGEEAESEAEAADPTAQPSGQPRVSATRGFSLSTTRPATTRPKATAPSTTRPNRRQTASRPADRPARPPVQQQGRVDLRLSFLPGSAELSAVDIAQVRSFAEALQRPQLANVRIRIEGHTDSSGGRALNQTLSQRRAQAVANFLTSQGIDASRLEVRGFAYDRPLPGLPASAGENRRVEAVRVS